MAPSVPVDILYKLPRRRAGSLNISLFVLSYSARACSLLQAASYSVSTSGVSRLDEGASVPSAARKEHSMKRSWGSMLGVAGFVIALPAQSAVLNFFVNLSGLNEVPATPS